MGRRRVAIVHNDLWLNTLDTVNAFDTANASTGTVKRREAQRFTSASQTGAGEFLRVSASPATTPGTSRTATTSFFTHHLRLI
jgi:hypothetical protein